MVPIDKLNLLRGSPKHLTKSLRSEGDFHTLDQSLYGRLIVNQIGVKHTHQFKVNSLLRRDKMIPFLVFKPRYKVKEQVIEAFELNFFPYMIVALANLVVQSV